MKPALFIFLLLLSSSSWAAHYAELDANNVVIRVVVIEDLGSEAEEIAWCQSFFGGGTWVKTVTDGSLRKNYAGRGYIYHPGLNLFSPPKPYPSWVLEAARGLWEAPIARPSEPGAYVWDEALGNWKKVENRGIVP